MGNLYYENSTTVQRSACISYFRFFFKNKIMSTNWFWRVSLLYCSVYILQSEIYLYHLVACRLASTHCVLAQCYFGSEKLLLDGRSVVIFCVNIYSWWYLCFSHLFLKWKNLSISMIRCLERRTKNPRFRSSVIHDSQRLWRITLDKRP